MLLRIILPCVIVSCIVYKHCLLYYVLCISFSILCIVLCITGELVDRYSVLLDDVQESQSVLIEETKQAHTLLIELQNVLLNGQENTAPDDSIHVSENATNYEQVSSSELLLLAGV